MPIETRNAFNPQFLLSLSMIILFAVAADCSSRADTNSIQEGKVLAEGALSQHDRDSGVVQASPGISPDSGIFSVLGRLVSIDSGAFTNIPDETSVLRFKLLSHPPLHPRSDGIVHMVAEYERIGHLFRILNRTGRNMEENFQWIRLSIDRIEVYSAGTSSGGENQIRTVLLTGNDRSILLSREGHYTPLIRNLALPAGKYTGLKVFFQAPGEISFDGETAYPIYVNNNAISFSSAFSVEGGKITSLNVAPFSEHGEYRWNLAHGASANQEEPYSDAREIRSQERPDRGTRAGNIPESFALRFGLREVGSAVYSPAEKVFLSIKSITAKNERGRRIQLNETPSVFEVLSLLNGSVALLGQNSIPEGGYSEFEISFSGTQTLLTRSETEEQTIDFRSSRILRLKGPFQIRGGRITEVFLRFDPTRSIFYLPDHGYVFDPSLELTSVVSTTPEQDRRVIAALGKHYNLVACESETALQVSVNSVVPTIAKNMHGETMIYSDLALTVEDRLRGSVGLSDHFALRTIGGSYNGMGLRVAGMPAFRAGEHCLIFLKDTGGRPTPVRGEWGKVNL